MGKRRWEIPSVNFFQTHNSYIRPFLSFGAPVSHFGVYRLLQRLHLFSLSLFTSTAHTTACLSFKKYFSLIFHFSNLQYYFFGGGVSEAIGKSMKVIWIQVFISFFSAFLVKTWRMRSMDSFGSHSSRVPLHMKDISGKKFEPQKNTPPTSKSSWRSEDGMGDETILLLFVVSSGIQRTARTLTFGI